MTNDAVNPNSSSTKMIGIAIAYYLAAIGLCYTTTSIGIYFDNAAGEWIFVAGYLGAGLLLNRKVLRQLEWHPMYNTLGAVAISKLFYFLLWPLAYGLLIIQLMINFIL